MKLISKYKGGSHSYGLNTAASDIDWRGVFINTELSKLVGLERHEHQQDKSNGKDEEYKELREFLRLLSQANTQAVELLFHGDFDTLEPEFQLIKKHKIQLLDSERLFKCLCGYIQGELKLANGERTGRLGSKRKDAIELYGYSPKNFVQLLRLAWAGTVFFKTGVFPVKVSDFDEPFSKLLLSIKTQPHLFNKAQLNEMAALAESRLKEYFDNRRYDYQFNHALANELCYTIYLPYILDAKKELKSLTITQP